MKPGSYSSKVNDGLPAFSVFYQNFMINDYQLSNLFKLKAFALTKGKVRSAIIYCIVYSVDESKTVNIIKHSP